MIGMKSYPRVESTPGGIYNRQISTKVKWCKVFIVPRRIGTGVRCECCVGKRQCWEEQLDVRPSYQQKKANGSGIIYEQGSGRGEDYENIILKAILTYSRDYKKRKRRNWGGGGWEEIGRNRDLALKITTFANVVIKSTRKKEARPFSRNAEVNDQRCRITKAQCERSLTLKDKY